MTSKAEIVEVGQGMARVESNLDSVLADAFADKSESTATKYRQRIGYFLEWKREQDEPLSKALIGKFIKHLASQGKSASTVNGYLVAIRVVLREGAEAGLLDQNTAERLAKMKAPSERGEAVGVWLSHEEAQSLLDTTLQPKDEDVNLLTLRDRCILGLFLFCGLRRSEIVALNLGHLQERDGHFIIADLISKHGRKRTIKIPVALKRTIDQWLELSLRASLKSNSALFVRVPREYHRGYQPHSALPEAPLSSQSIYNIVLKYAERIGKPKVRPHDLRRTFAKHVHRGGAALDQISLTLGHESLETTQRYLGLDLDLDSAPSDFLTWTLNGDDA